MGNTRSIDFELSSSQVANITDGNQTGLDILGDISQEAWIKLEQLPSTAGTNFAITARSTSTASTAAWIWQLLVSDRLQFFYQDGLGDNGNIQTANNFFDGDDVGTWVHVAVVVDVSTTDALFYKDGVETVSGSNTGTATAIRNVTLPFEIGGITDAAGANFFDGKQDEVRVWDDLRSEAEIQNNRLKQLNGDEGNLQGYWRFNNSLLDETSNDNDLTGVNGPVFSTDSPFGAISDVIGTGVIPFGR